MNSFTAINSSLKADTSTNDYLRLIYFIGA